MKKMLISLITLLTISFNTQAAFTYMAPGQMVILGLFSCGGGSASSLTNLAEQVVECAVAVPMTGLRMIDESLNSDEGVFGRLLYLTVGLIVLDEQTGSIDLNEIDLKSIPKDVTLSEAKSFNSNIEELRALLDETTGFAAGQKEISGNEIVDEFEKLALEMKVPEEAKRTLYKVIQQ